MTTASKPPHDAATAVDSRQTAPQDSTAPVTLSVGSASAKDISIAHPSSGWRDGSRVFAPPLPPGSRKSAINSEYDRPERKRGARLMLIESLSSAVPAGIQGNLLGGFALKLGATSFQMGMYSAIVDMFIAVSLMFAAHIVRLLGGRKRMLIATMLAGALPWVFLAVVPLMSESVRVWAMIPLAGAATALMILGDPAWNSWMSDLVPSSRRGRYLGVRGSMVTLTTMSVGMSAAAVLDRLHGAVMWGFAAAFLVAAAARIVSLVIYTRIPDPRPDLKLHMGPMPWTQFRQMNRSVLGRYNKFLLLFHFAAGIGSPFFSVYLLRDLGVSFTVYVGLNMVCNIAVALTMPWWGRLVDRRGNMFVLVLSGLAVALWPIVHVFSTSILYLFVAYAVVGMTQAGWGIVLYNFVLERSEDTMRTSAVGYSRGVISLGMFTGALLGGLIATRVPAMFGYPLLTMCVITTVLRVASIGVLPSVLKDESNEGQGYFSRLAGLLRSPKQRLT
ncbi:MAG: MFS transporter [SAR202 cluster bacterium]|nr:MFS transporter [SAR202 cluster bacterium]